MIELIRGDITQVKADAIVNAANSKLQGGGGVDGAIHAAAGPVVMEECQQYVARHGELPTGEAMLTKAGELGARYIIHTVGPIWRSGLAQEELLLANCYLNSLRLAQKKDLKSIAFPNISTGVYGYPLREAAEVAIAAVSNFLASHSEGPQVKFVCFDDENYGIYQRLLRSSS